MAEQTPCDDPLGYDELPYPSGPYPYSHCDHLATVARLFGIPSTDVRQCRVLEIGCADGANLIPMALTLPGSQFVGIDLSRRQVQAGRELIAELELGNVQLHQQDLTTYAGEAAKFDYIIAHGVYSWTTLRVRDSLLRLIRDCLAPRGVGLVSYNVLPGWQQRQALREWLLRATAGSGGTAARLGKARQRMAGLRDALHRHGNAAQQHLARTIAQLENCSDGYLRHDLLEDTNQPCHVVDFVDHAAAHGLRFLAEADVASMVGAGLPAELAGVAQRLGGSLVAREQLLDVLTERAFRQSLLCHADCAPSTQLDVTAVRGAYVVSSFERQTGGGAESDTVAYVSPSGMRLRGDDPVLVGALDSLQRAWPGGAWFDQLLPAESVGEVRESQADTLAATLLAAFVERAVELRSVALPLAATVEEYPRASPLARLQARRSEVVTNLRHDIVRLAAPARELLPYLDGTRDRRALADLCRAPTAEGDPQQHLAALLDGLRRRALLLG
ncbi:MAG: methyltransferase regulatory domain-containing protein [Pirellulaceae bacterium]|nr:methyltransferase regulatory domain-containing protein [Pirellulaceae bacterium]